MGDPAQGPAIRLPERASRLGHRLLVGAGDPAPGDEDFRLLGLDVDGDIDAGAGIGVVWLAHGEQMFRCDYEQDVAGAWEQLGGGSGSVGPELGSGPRPSAASVGTPLLAAVGGIGFTRSRRDRQIGDASLPPPSFDAVGFVASLCLRVADVVDHVVVAGRTISVPDHGWLVVVWKAPPGRSGPIARPPVVAVDALGRELAVLAPLGPFDDVTLRALTDPGPERSGP